MFFFSNHFGIISSKTHRLLPHLNLLSSLGCSVYIIRTGSPSHSILQLQSLERLKNSINFFKFCKRFSLTFCSTPTNFSKLRSTLLEFSLKHVFLFLIIFSNVSRNIIFVQNFHIFFKLLKYFSSHFSTVSGIQIIIFIKECRILC